MYLTYDEYLNYGGDGDAVNELAFEQLEFEAASVIDWYTFNRLQDDTEFPESVKRCMFALIQLALQEHQTLYGADPILATQTGAIASQSNDGVSISYNTLSAIDLLVQCKDASKKLIMQYLQNTRNSLGKRVLYRGLYPDE